MSDEPPLSIATHHAEHTQTVGRLLRATEYFPSVSPAIPVELVRAELSRGGCHSDDASIHAVASLATQHFMGKLVEDALNYSVLRTRNKEDYPKGHPEKSESVRCLRIEDVIRSARENGVEIGRESFVADTVASGVSNE